MLEKMADEVNPQSSSGYGKRPLWQWIILYLFIAVVVYGLVYYFVFGKKGGNNYSTSSQYPTSQPTSAQSVSPTTSPTSSPSAMQAITVVGTEFAFSPSTITVKKGQEVKVTFKNNGTYPHNFTLSALNVKTDTIDPGQMTTVTFTPTTTGSFTYICTVPGHADRGMKGTLIVQ